MSFKAEKNVGLWLQLWNGVRGLWDDTEGYKFNTRVKLGINGMCFGGYLHGGYWSYYYESKELEYVVSLYRHKSYYTDDINVKLDRIFYDWLRNTIIEILTLGNEIVISDRNTHLSISKKTIAYIDLGGPSKYCGWYYYSLNAIRSIHKEDSSFTYLCFDGLKFPNKYINPLIFKDLPITFRYIISFILGNDLFDLETKYLKFTKTRLFGTLLLKKKKLKDIKIVFQRK